MSIKISIILLLSILSEVAGHAFLHTPISRNAVGMVGNGLCTWGGDIPCDGCPHCVNVPEPNTGCGIWQNNKLEPKLYGSTGLGYGNTGYKTTYTAGDLVEMKVEISTYHGGMVEFRLMDVGSNIDPDGSLWESQPRLKVESFSPACDDSSQCSPEPCLDEKECAPIPLNIYGNHNGVLKAMVRIPSDVTCEHCVLQWRYNTGNSCWPDWVSCPGSERFWNCADLKILAADGSQPPVPPSVTTAIPTAIPVSAPTKSPVSGQTLVPSVQPTQLTQPAPSNRDWSNQCMCEYSSGCLSDSDCCSGLICFDHGLFSQCIEDPSYALKETLPNPSCKSVATHCDITEQDFGCVSDSDCCNPSAKCGTDGMCNFPETCTEARVEPTRAPTMVPPTTPTTPTTPVSSLALSTNGNQIVDSNGNNFRLTGINWFGCETASFTFHGLWTGRSYKDFLDQVKELNFNVLRVPFSGQLLRSDSMVSGINTNSNPELIGLSPLQVLTKVVEYAGEIGLRVFLDRHSSKADGLLNEDLWYIANDVYYTEQQWIEDWKFMANHFKGHNNVIGADVYNEPKRTAEWSVWARAAEKAGNAIHEIAPSWLIIVEGVEVYDGESTWWGGNLRGFASDPVVLNSNNKLVLSPHEYDSHVSAQAWFSDPSYPSNLPGIWDTNWGYIYKNNIAPLIIGEFGSKLSSQTDITWLDKVTDYMDGDFNLDGVSDLVGDKKGLSFTYWCLNPNSGDTGGILNADWTTVDQTKYDMLKNSLEGVDPVEIPTSYTPTIAPIVTPTKPTSSSPTMTPIARPTTPTTPTNPTTPTSTGNPYIDNTNYYVNPTYKVLLESSIDTSNTETRRVLNHMKDISSAYWLDVKEKVYGNTTFYLQGILEDAKKKAQKQLVTFIIYDLPNRDCHAVASNGQLCCTYKPDGRCDYDAVSDCSDGLAQYRTEYIDPIFDVLSQYQNDVDIVLVIEPDSLPNLATNLDDPHCSNQATQNSYKMGISYAVNKFGSLKVTQYLDAGHGGWLGWSDNLNAFATILYSMDMDIQNLRGFATNTANYQPIGTKCPFQSNDGLRNNYCLNGANQDKACCADPCGLSSQWNQGNNEMNYADALKRVMSQKFPGFTPHMIIDSGRNGVTDMRQQCANWCNARNAGVGVLPTTQTGDLDLVDAFYWLKTPGESDGCTEKLPNGESCPRFDTMCASSDSIGSASDEPRAPEAGHWFDYQIKQLAMNAVFKDTIPITRLRK